MGLCLVVSASGEGSDGILPLQDSSNPLVRSLRIYECLRLQASDNFDDFQCKLTFSPYMPLIFETSAYFKLNQGLCTPVTLMSAYGISTIIAGLVFLQKHVL